MLTPIRSLQIRPAKSADLAFNMSGIIEFRRDQLLGNRVSALAYPYKQIEIIDANAPLDPNDLLKLFKDQHLFSLRNQPAIVALWQALARRQLALHERLKHGAAIADATTKRVKSLNENFENLRNAIAARDRSIQAQFKADAGMQKALDAVRWHSPDVRTETVVKSPIVATASVPVQGMTKIQAEGEHQTQVWEAEPKKDIKDGDEDATHYKKKKTLQYYLNSQSASVPIFRNNGDWKNDPASLDQDHYVAQTSTTSNKLVADPNAPPIDGGDLMQPSHPWEEYKIAHAQASIRVGEDYFQAQLADITAKSVADAMQAELRVINTEVMVLQLNLLHTLLVAPFDGQITAVYKDIGENVEAGEPVCRLEDASWVVLAGRIQRRQAVFADDKVLIACGRSFQDKSSEPFEATVVSVRGHDANDNEWDVLLRAKNPVRDGKLMLPANGSLDPATTEIEWR